jgi:hypothetical protein
VRLRLMLCVCVATIVLLNGGRLLADDDDHDHGHGHGHAYGHEKHRDRDDDDRGGYRYSRHDYEVMRGWYHEHYEHLPPGLAKRDRLPPGLERRLVVNAVLPVDLRSQIRPCPYELEEQLPPPPPSYEHAVIGGHIVLMNRKSFVVVDIFHLER